MPSKKAAPRTLRLSGEQTVRTIAETHTVVVSALSQTGDVTLDASAVEEADLTFVQLIESARLTAAAAGKRFRVAGPLSQTLREQLERGAFLHTGSSASFWKSITP